MPIYLPNPCDDLNAARSVRLFVLLDRLSPLIQSEPVAPDSNDILPIGVDL